MTHWAMLRVEKRKKVIKRSYERRGERLYERTKSGATGHNVYFVKYIFPRNRTSSDLS